MLTITLKRKPIIFPHAITIRRLLLTCQLMTNGFIRSKKPLNLVLPKATPVISDELFK